MRHLALQEYHEILEYFQNSKIILLSLNNKRQIYFLAQTIKHNCFYSRDIMNLKVKEVSDVQID